MADLSEGRSVRTVTRLSHWPLGWDGRSAYVGSTWAVKRQEGPLLRLPCLIAWIHWQRGDWHTLPSVYAMQQDPHNVLHEWIVTASTLTALQCLFTAERKMVVFTHSTPACWGSCSLSDGHCNWSKCCVILALVVLAEVITLHLTEAWLKLCKEHRTLAGSRHWHATSACPAMEL